MHVHYNVKRLFLESDDVSTILSKKQMVYNACSLTIVVVVMNDP
jgi:hypothetical protein